MNNFLNFLDEDTKKYFIYFIVACFIVGIFIGVSIASK
jgi:hypothetical protein